MRYQQIRVLLVDDHAMVRKGMNLFLQEYEGISIIGEAANGLKAIELSNQLRPDVILMDLAMPIMDGFQAIRRIMSAHPNQRIVVLTGSAEEEDLLSAIQAGAIGYIKKNARVEELIQSIRDAYDGKPTLDQMISWKILQGMIDMEKPKRSTETLSEREIEVLSLLTRGKRDNEIAQELFLAEVTIRTHINRIMNKLHLKNRVQAALYGLQSGLVPLNETNPTADIQ